MSRLILLLITLFIFFGSFGLKIFAQNKYTYRGSVEASASKGIPYSETLLSTTHGVVLQNNVFIGFGVELSNLGKGTKFFNNKGGYKFEKSSLPYYYIMGDYPLYPTAYTPILALRLGSQKLKKIDLLSPSIGFKHTLSKLFSINVALFYEWKKTRMKVDFDSKYLEQVDENLRNSLDNIEDVKLNSVGVRLGIEF